MFEQEIAEGWVLVENYGGYQTNKCFPYCITRWFNERMNAETYVVVDGNGDSQGAYKSYEDAEECAKHLAKINSYATPM